MWDGAFAKATKFSKNPDKPTVIPDKADPPDDIPGPEELEVYQGGGTITRAWQYGGVTYVTVHYNEGNAPSNAIGYVYVYFENDLQDIQDSALGPIDSNGFFE